LLAIPVLAFAAGCATLGGSMQSAVIRAKDKVAPALVHIRPVKEIFTSGKREEVQVVGSGFIISPDGYVVTNEHVASEAKFVRCVLFNKEEVEAKVVGGDPYTDIAVLKLNTSATDLPHVKLGDSAKLEAGETVLALGSPHGLARSVSVGIVSVTDRYLEDRGDEMVSPFNTWIQTDAAINPGNSGGPLVNLKGEVIGVNARILTGAENVGFAIPINTAKEVVDQIIKNSRVVRSWIGESLQPMRVKTEDPKKQGVVIGDVDPLSPGYEAGLRSGDVLLSIDGKPTNARFEEDLPAVRKLIADLPVGKQVAVHVVRGDQEQDFAVLTAERSQLHGNQVEFPEWGFTAVDLTENIVRRAQLPSKRGILVTGSQVGGIAANARLERGDIILKVDDAELRNLASFQGMYKDFLESKKRLIMLQVKRGALTRFVLVKQEGETGSPAEPGPAPEGEGGRDHVE
jgi:serine protease Do